MAEKYVYLSPDTYRVDIVNGDVAVLFRFASDSAEVAGAPGLAMTLTPRDALALAERLLEMARAASGAPSQSEPIPILPGPGTTQ